GQVYREYNNYVQSHPVAAGLKTGQAVWQELGPRKRVDYGGYLGLGRVNAIAFHPTDTATVYGGAPNGGFWITHDGGRTWDSPTDKLPTMGVSAILVNPVTPNVILIGTGDRDAGDSYGLGVFRSDDGGLTWEQSNTGMGDVTVGMFARPESNLRMILSAANGGIFKTIDGGENWIRTSPDSSNYRDIKFRPGSATIAYATSETGFYRTENGGDSWTRVPNSDGYPANGRLVIGLSPANDSLVYLVGGESVGPFQGCFLSRNLGKTFSVQSTSPNILGWEYDGSDFTSQTYYNLVIYVDPINPLIVYVGGVNIWKSIDGGKKWTLIVHWYGDHANLIHADEHAFAFNPANKRLYAGNDGGIYYTENQGTSWKNISEGLGIGQIYRIGVSSIDGEKTIAGFQDNGSATLTGTSWSTAGGGDGMDCAVDPKDSRYSYGSVQYGTIYRCFNNVAELLIAGKDINGINEDGAWTTPLLLSERDEKTMVVGYKNIWICRNVKASGAITWTKISNNLAGRNNVNMYLMEQSPADANLLFAEGMDGKVFRTENLLSSSVVWTDITAKLPFFSAGVYDIECHPYDPNTLYMINNLNVYKSINRGNTWQNISGSLPAIYKAALVFDKTSNEGLYLGTEAGVFYKDADMADWVMYGQSFPVSVGVTELEIYNDPRNRADSRLRASTYGRGAWETKLAESNAVLAPYLLTAVLVDRDAELSWEPVFYEQNLQGYRIYRNGVLLSLVSGYTYTDIKIEADVTYAYKVSALYSGGKESGFTNEAFITMASPIELPYSQPFEKGNGGFTAKYSLEGWKYGTAETLAVTGREGHFFAANSAAAGEGVVVKDYLVSPEIHLSSYAGKTITLKFAYTMRKYRTYDKFSVNYRTSPDSAWIKIVDLKPPSTQTWVWDTTEVNLPAKALTAKAQIGFLYDNSSQFAYGAAVDDIDLFVNTTSVQTIDNLTYMKVFPNPNKGQFTMELASGVTGVIKLQIVNITGQVVLEKTIENNPGKLTEMIDLSGQPKGVYQITVRSKSAEWKQKITIQ
ncbi:MAG: T9SS type A sorting domain-containing protein, partial [Bacteroidia bacterium]|nr:T9SS type A sorting domain-containing protein [Bacteroidia bacterium]